MVEHLANLLLGIQIRGSNSLIHDNSLHSTGLPANPSQARLRGGPGNVFQQPKRASVAKKTFFLGVFARTGTT